MSGSAGILLVGPGGESLFVKRSDTREWAVPAGHIEPGETPWVAAKREFFEETGYSGPFLKPFLLRYFRNKGGGFWLFRAETPEIFRPILDWEHTSYVWGPSGTLPEPLHWGLRWLRN